MLCARSIEYTVTVIPATVTSTNFFPGLTQPISQSRGFRTTLTDVAPLRSVISGSPCGDLTFLINDLNRPFTEAGFGNKFRDWCNQAGLHHCTARGLRKAGATIAANNGPTSRQLMVIFGWESIRMADQYTRGADQKQLAEDAMHLIQAKAVVLLSVSMLLAYVIGLKSG